MTDGAVAIPAAPEGGSGYQRLRHFLKTLMSMSHVYQPIMVRTILEGGGAATRRQIAAAFLAADLSQLEYYEQIVSRYPTDTLKRRGIIEHQRGVYRLTDEMARMNEWERASLIALCDAKVADYIAHRQDAIWRHRSQNFEPVPGTVRYRVIKRAMGRCEACGVSTRERALQVDHVEPRSTGGSNEMYNLQALCSTCNAQKLDRDRTDFHAAHDRFAHRPEDCRYCYPEAALTLENNELAFVIRGPAPDEFAVVARRHGSTYENLIQPEVNAIRALELGIFDALDASRARDYLVTATSARHEAAPHCLVWVAAAAS